MRMRRVLATAATVGLLAFVTGCSVPSGYGVRLNHDGTVDFVDCLLSSASSFDFVVDYLMTAGIAEGEPVEWEVAADDPNKVQELFVIKLYGEAPDGYTTVSLSGPPEGWLYVEYGGHRAYRGDLTEGEWQWHDTTRTLWGTQQPCEGLDLDDLEG